MSMPGTYFRYVSKYSNIMDAYFRHVHSGDMKIKIAKRLEISRTKRPDDR
jgi:hypothetical protein